MLYRLSLLVVGTFLTASCDIGDMGQNFTKPTSPVTNASSVSVSTTSAVAQPVSDPLCPSVTPFNVPFAIVVQPTGAFNVVVTAIRLQFVDTSGVGMPSVTLSAPVPNEQFGTSQVFPVSLGIGCGTGFKGNVQVLVETRDDQGRTGSVSTTVPVV